MVSLTAISSSEIKFDDLSFSEFETEALRWVSSEK